MESTITRNYSNNDNALLLSYQEEYLRTGSADAWGKMFALSVQVCRNIIDGRCRKNNLFFDEFTKEDFSMNAAIYVLRRYKEGCRIHKKEHAGSYQIKNFITSLDLGVTHALYSRNGNNRLYDQTCSLEANSSIVNSFEDTRIDIENDALKKMHYEKIMQLVKAAFFIEKQ